MPPIPILVAEILSVVTQILSLLGLIRQQQEPLAKEHYAYEIATLTSEQTQYEHGATTGFPAILAAIADLRGYVTTQDSGLLAAIANIPSPPTPPTVEAIAGGVWGVQDNASQFPYLTYGEELAQSHQWAAMMWHAGSLPARWAPFFNISAPPPGIDSRPTDFTWPMPAWGEILPDDTLITWLARTEPNFTWQQDGSGEGIIGYLTSLPEYDAPHYTAKLTNSEWLRLYGGLRNAAPIWPGIDLITPGEPVALVDQLVVAGPLHGVLVDATTRPPGASQWNLGDMPAYYRWGEVSFVTDNGEAEQFQYLAFGLGVYLPKTMAVAASAIFRVDRVPTATVTPFTIP